MEIIFYEGQLDGKRGNRDAALCRALRKHGEKRITPHNAAYFCAVMLRAPGLSAKTADPAVHRARYAALCRARYGAAKPA